MSHSFKRSLNRVLKVEGGYSDHSLDPGGKTKFGITEETAKDAGFDGKIEDLTFEEANRIYKKLYWDKMNLQDIAMLYEDVASEIFDAGVNMGVETASKFLQRSLNLFNKSYLEEPLYKELKVDGIIGEKTLSAFKGYHTNRGHEGLSVLVKAIKGLKVSYYFLIAEKNKELEAFTYGWIKNRG